MSSDEANFQKQRLVRLAGGQWPAYGVVFDERQPAKIRFGLQHRTNGKCSGRSMPALATDIREKKDAAILTIMQLMVKQCEQQL